MRVRRKKMTSFEKNQKLVTKKKRNSLFSGRENKRRRRESDKIHIPHEIVEEIIVKLPVKSLSRFKSVSKHWRNTFTSKDFEERHMSHQKTQDPKLLFVCDDLVNRADNALFLKTMALGTTSASVEDKECLEFQEFKGFLEISESCDGLVCIYGMKIPVEVLNPVTITFTTLPLAKIQKLLIDYLGTEPVPFTLFTRFGFGKDCVTGRYKLVWLYNKYPDSTSLSKKKVRCEVLDLEEKNWRFVNTTPLDHHHILFNQRPVFVNGSLYWLTGDEEGDPTTETKLIVFDIHTEMFQVIQTPPFISRDASGDKIGVCNLDGRLCISELKKDCKQEFWWRAEDNNTWERIFSVDLHSTSTWFGGITSHPLTPLTISKYTNKVILSLTDQESLVAFDLDPNSMVYHLYFSGYYGLAVPYFPSLLRP